MSGIARCMTSGKQWFAVFVGVFATSIFSSVLFADEKVDPAEWLVQQSLSLDTEQIGDHRTVYYLTSIAGACDRLGRSDLSEQIIAAALEIANRDEKRATYQTLFRYAEAKGDLKLATIIAEGAVQNRDSHLNRLDLMKYRLGDQHALENYPRGEQDFYNAMDLARTYVEMGEYDLAEKYVTGIKISEENDPRAVTGLILRDIANAHRKQGRQKLAEKTVDKAFNIGGGLYYTGYVIEIAHRSIHGGLEEGLDKFAQRGERYRGHMGKELVGSLISELIEIKQFQNARKTANHLKESKDRHRYLAAIAVAMVKAGQPGDAFEIINEISDQSAQTLARIQLAAALWSLGEKESSKNLVKFAASKLAGQPFSECEEILLAMAGLYAQTGDFSKVQSISRLAEEPLQRLKIINSALEGYAIAVIEQNVDSGSE